VPESPPSKKINHVWGIFIVLSVCLTTLTIRAIYAPDLPYELAVSQLKQVDSQFLDIGHGEKVHYTDTGDPNKAILFLHGANMSHDKWKHWAATLKSSYRIIAIDLPNHGLTNNNDGYLSYNDMAAFTDRVINHLDLKDFTLAGHSMAGGVALAYSHLFKDKATALILIAPAR